MILINYTPKSTRLVVGLIFLFFGAFSLSARGELVWDKTQVELEVKELEESVSTSFIVTNAGGQDIEILSVDTDCSCLSFQVSTNSIRPGESLRLWFKIGVKDGGGLGITEARVNMKEGEREFSQLLEISVVSPELFSISSRRIVWGLGEVDTRVVELKVKKSSGVNFYNAKVYGTNPETFRLDILYSDTSSLEYDLYYLCITPSFPSQLNPKLGAVCFVGVELTKGDRLLQTLIEVINWPVNQS
jgi:hypothetical protein